MKKILTLAIMAILLGGFAFNANAQEPLKGKSQTKKTVVKTDVKGTLDKTLKDYEQAVEKCLTLYYAKEKGDKNDKTSLQEFQTSLTKAETLKKTLENSKKDMDRTQVDRFNKASQKLLKVYED